MRVVIFWAMCHHSLGHEKKALLNVKVRFPYKNGLISPFPIYRYITRSQIHQYK